LLHFVPSIQDASKLLDRAAHGQKPKVGATWQLERWLIGIWFPPALAPPNRVREVSNSLVGGAMAGSQAAAWIGVA
jgi:hypothetical protein